MPTTHDTHRTDVQMRFADTDALGHINNATFATYAELARLEFLSKLGGSVRSLILASIYLDFRRQVQLGETVHVESWIEKLGNSSFTIAQTIFANGEKAADVKSVVVHFDYSAQKSQPLSADMRNALAPFLVLETHRSPAP
jgi:acyl-CoA thioester hydrolase